MKKEYIIPVTVLVASYNPDWKKLKQTVMSVIIQKGIDIEIIVADDGSEENYFIQLIELFNYHRFKRFKLISLSSNKGTCHNIYNGLQSSSGEYVKTIGTGDCLFDENTLLNWYQFAKSHNADICFGDAIFFTSDKPKKIISKKRYPQKLSIYGEDYNVDKAIKNYIFLGDSILGSNFLTRTKLLEKYLKAVLGKIKYAEDMLYRVMILDGAKVQYYNVNVIWYEFGNGISTNGDSNWNKIIAKERLYINHYIQKHNPYKGILRLRFIICMEVLCHKYLKWIKYILYPELVIYKLEKNRINAYTSLDADLDKLNFYDE